MPEESKLPEFSIYDDSISSTPGLTICMLLLEPEMLPTPLPIINIRSL